MRSSRMQKIGRGDALMNDFSIIVAELKPVWWEELHDDWTVGYIQKALVVIWRRKINGLHVYIPKRAFERMFPRYKMLMKVAKKRDSEPKLVTIKCRGVSFEAYRLRTVWYFYMCRHIDKRLKYCRL